MGYKETIKVLVGAVILLPLIPLHWLCDFTAKSIKRLAIRLIRWYS